MFDILEKLRVYQILTQPFCDTLMGITGCCVFFWSLFSVRDKPTKLWYQNNPYALKGKHVGTESVFGGKTDPFLLISTTVKERNRCFFVFLTFPIDMITNKWYKFELAPKRKFLRRDWHHFPHKQIWIKPNGSIWKVSRVMKIYLSHNLIMICSFSY